MDKVEQVRRVLELIEDGMSERSACAEVGISRSTFRTTALRVNSGDHYARALEALAQDQVEKAEQVIEDMRSGVIDAQQARVELDARKWFASKFLPKRYGDKAEVEHSGNVGLTVNVVRLTDADNNPAA
jgi:hypothetical protein